MTGSAITIQERQATPKKTQAPYNSVGIKTNTKTETSPRAHEGHRKSAGRLEVNKEVREIESVMRIKRHTTYGKMLGPHDLESKEVKHLRANSTGLQRGGPHTSSHLVLRMPSIAAEDIELAGVQGSYREEVRHSIAKEE